MNKLLSIAALWALTLTASAQLITDGDWDYPENPGLKTNVITVSSSNGAYGTADVTTETAYGTGTYPQGVTLSLVATPKAGYSFVSWTLDGQVVSNEASCSYVMPDKNVSLVANFAANKYTVSFEVDGVVAKTENLDFGAAITKPADPVKSGYTFAGWTPDVAATVPVGGATYQATWTTNKYDVSFSVDGSVIKTDELAYGAAITKPADPVKTGYTFAGWSPAVAATVPVGGASYSATWTINKYNVTFNADNGTENIVYNQDYASEIVAPANPVKTGYTFAGWAGYTSGAKVPAQDVSFTANWNVNQYKVAFVVDGVETSANQNYGSAITKPSDPAKTGYTFTGWSPAVDATVPANDVTYTAQFSVNKYTVSFIVDGKEVQSQSLDYGTVISVPADPEKKGYNFDGWDGYVAGATVPAKDVAYTAKFSNGAFKVTFIVDGKVYSTKSMDFGQTVILPTEPSKEGYTFAGWTGYTEGATVPAEDVSYSATWTVNKYNVTFDVDGTKTTSSLEYGSSVTKPADPVKTGYTFAGWSPAVDATVPASDREYSATWTINKYNVSFVVDGKTFSTATVDYNSAISVPATTPSKEGYTFAGWTGYTDGATVPAEDVSFDAAWTVNKYTVSFISEGNKVTESELDFGSAITAPANPAKTGYTFVGWTPEVAATVPVGGATYTANFKINQYKVEFVVDGQVVKSATLDYGSDIIAPTTDPSKDGYTFTGWSPAVGTVPADDVTFVATWGEGVWSNIVIEGAYVVPEGTTLKVSALDINLSTLDTPMTSIINNGTIEAGKTTLNITVPNGKWSFIKFPCNVPVSELKNSQVGTTWQIMRYDAAARAAVDLDNVWVAMTNSDVLSANEGYIIQSRREDSENKTSTFTFTTSDASAIAAIVNGKDTKVSVKANASTYASNAGWNLVGNPYLAYLDSREVTSSPIIVWENNTYRAYTPDVDKYVLSPLQAFFMQTTEDSALDVDSDGRQTDASAPASAKSRVNSANSDRFDLTITDGANIDYTRVVLSDDASADYEVGADAAKFMSMNNSVPQIYTVDNNTSYSINVRPAESNVVALGVYVANEGQYTISAESAAAPFALVDSETNEVVILGNGTDSYTFSAEAGTYTKRFKINFNVEEATGINAAKASNSSSETIYTIQGVSVREASQRGIYIVNGKKVVK